MAFVAIYHSLKLYQYILLKLTDILFMCVYIRVHLTVALEVLSL